jgi:hypothetical protein
MNSLKEVERVMWEDDARNDLRKMGVKNRGCKRGNNGKK